jgi:hypothetical protein
VKRRKFWPRIGTDETGYDLIGFGSLSAEIRVDPWQIFGSACGPVIVPVFKTGERRAIPSLVGSTPTRFRHNFARIHGFSIGFEARNSIAHGCKPSGRSQH